MRNVRWTMLALVAALALLGAATSQANADDGANWLVDSAIPDADPPLLVPPPAPDANPGASLPVVVVDAPLPVVVIDAPLPVVVINAEPVQLVPIVSEVIGQVEHAIDPGDPGLPPD